MTLKKFWKLVFARRSYDLKAKRSCFYWNTVYMQTYAVNESAHNQQASFLAGHYASCNEQKTSPDSCTTISGSDGLLVNQSTITIQPTTYKSQYVSHQTNREVADSHCCSSFHAGLTSARTPNGTNVVRYWSHYWSNRARKESETSIMLTVCLGILWRLMTLGRGDAVSSAFLPAESMYNWLSITHLSMVV